MSHHKSDHAKIKEQNGARRGKRVPRKITASYLHNSGLYYLERFAASKAHFKSVMVRKVRRSCMHHVDQDFELCVQMVDDLADKFERSGLLDDAVYTRGVVSSLRRRGKARNAIVQKMMVKGIDRERTLEALDRLDYAQCESAEDAERQAALKLARKKRLGPYFAGEEQDIKKSLGVFARAGFSYAVATFILDMDEEVAEDLLTREVF